MSILLSKHVLITCVSLLSISIYSQENVTKEKNNIINTHSHTNSNQMPVYTSQSRSEMAINNPNYELDKQINLTLINDTKKEEVLITVSPNTNSFSSLLLNSKKELTLGALAKKIKES